MALGMKKPIKEQEESKTVEINAQMQGSLIFSDPVNLKINGQFTGTLNTKGTLTIGDSAQVEAEIIGDNIVVAGKIKGNITANKMLVLMPTAILRGDVFTPKLNIVEGAVFQGHCQMQISDSLLNIDEVAKYLEIEITEIERLATSGKIPAIRNGNQWKFERSKIDNWATTGKVA
jgi:excisionase family DNA binding protein